MTKRRLSSNSVSAVDITDMNEEVGFWKKNRKIEERNRHEMIRTCNRL